VKATIGLIVPVLILACLSEARPAPLSSDAAGLLPAEARQRISAAAAQFQRATGRSMAVIVVPHHPTGNAAIESGASGITVILSASDPRPALVLVDPEWRTAAPRNWMSVVESVLSNRFHDLPFEQRAVEGVELLARVLPDKIALIMHPRPPPGEGSEAGTFSRYALQAFELFFWYILAYTLYRTVHENRLKPDDTDPFSEELRRLRNQPYRW
jgi:hypothetical protein